ncbi:site-specific integrase, partial [Vibrio parahaemolyticus]|nr:site-specific integrase [Vibrio parahaemolyticus]
MATVQRKISDKEIERCLADTTITEINAIGVPFVVRIHANRKTASWYLVSYKDGKTKRTKLANWPDLRTKQVLAQKDELIGKLALGDAPTLNEWQSVGDLLTWYRDRTVTNTTLNKKTRYDTKSIIDKHLLPMLGSENIAALTPALLETELIWPLQSCYALGTVKQYFSKLKRAFKVATRQKRLAFNPISEVIFKDFFDVKIKGKPSALLPKDLPMVVPLLSIQTALERLPGLMLLHGTRIGETRQLRWEFIDWYNATLTIPEALTKGSAPELVIPLTDYALTW